MAAEEEKHQEVQRQPAVFVNHGGGPMPYLQKLTNKPLQFGQGTIDQTTIIESCQVLGHLIKKHKPSALLIVSAHWEETIPSIIFKEKPPLLYDYYGFPPESYNLAFNTTCDTKLSQTLLKLFNDNGIKDVDLIKNRGWDHGVFIPLMCSGVEAKDLPPLMQLSLVQSLDAEVHVKLGSVLSALREESNVMIVGSGMLFHNMQQLRGGPNSAKYKKSKTFTDWIETQVSRTENDKGEEGALKKKIESMSNWANEGKYKNEARFCHPREEHLLPLHVVFGSNWNYKEYQLIMKENPSQEEKKEIEKLQSKLNAKITRAESFGSHVATCVFY